MNHQQLEQVVGAIEPQGKLLRAWRLTGGLSARMTAFEVLLPDGRTKKLILRQPGSAALKRNAAAEEFRLLQILQSAGIAAPVPCHLDQSGLVIEYVESEPEYAPANPVDLADQMAVQLARIHRIDGSTLSFLPRQTPFAEQYGKLPASGDSAAERRIREILREAGSLPSLNRPVLLHGDFWPGNLLWKDGQLAAVIDWEDAHVGDPLSDLAISRLDIRLIYGAEAMQVFTERYQALSDVRYAHLPYWDLCAALRAAPNLALWASGFPDLGRHDLTEQSMRDGLTRFVDQALTKL